MTRTPDASQTRYRKSDLAVVNMVRITTYTDRAAKTGASSFYLADQAIEYDYGNTGTNQLFWPVLDGTDDVVDSINHLPSPGDSVTSRAFTVTLDNIFIEGERLINVLRARNVVHALIEYSQLLLDSGPDAGIIDLTGLTGDEHTVFSRSVIVNPGPVTNDQIELQCETEIPSLADYWHYATASDVDPRDFGQRYPMPYGQKRRLKCISRDVGWMTTVAEPFGTGGGTLRLSDAGSLSGSVLLKIGNEEIRCSAPTPSTPFVGEASQPTDITITARALNGTKAEPHNAGEVVLEMKTSAVYSAAGSAIGAINAVYIENPVALGELVRVPDGAYTVDVADTTTDTFTTATITFSQSGLASMLRDMFTDVTLIPPVGTVTQSSFDMNTVATVVSSIGNDAFFTLSTSQAHWLGGIDSSGDPESAMAWHNATSSTLGVVRYKFYYSYRCDSGVLSGFAVQIKAYGFPGLSDGFIVRNKTFGTGDSGVLSGEGSWLSPPVGTVVNDLLNSGGSATSGPRLELIGYEPGDNDIASGVQIWVFPDDCGVTIEFTSNPADIGTTEFAGATIGFGLDVYADVDGITAPDGTYQAPSGSVLELDADVVKHFVEVVGGETVESATLATSVTNLGTNKLALDMRSFGFDFGECLARLGYETRSNIFPIEKSTGREWRMLQAGVDYKWDSPSTFLLATDRSEEAGRNLAELGTHFAFHFAPDPSRGDGVDAFRGVVIATPDVSDVSVTAAELTDAQERIGAVQAQAHEFVGIRHQISAQEIAGYYVHEGISETRRVITIPQVPWYDAYTLEIGDLRWVTPPWSMRAPEERIWPMDATTNWTGSGATLVADTSPAAPFEGSAVIEMTSTNPTPSMSSSTTWTNQADATRDIRGRALTIRVHTPQATYDDLHATLAVWEFTLQSSSGNSIAYGIPISRINADDWTDLVIPLTGGTETGSPDRTRINSLKIAFLPTSLTTGFIASVDDARFIDEPIACRIIEVAKNTKTEHADIVAVEVPSKPVEAAPSPGEYPSSTQYVQQALDTDASEDTDAAIKRQRQWARDGNTQDPLSHFAKIEPSGWFELEFDPPPTTFTGTQTIRIWCRVSGSVDISSVAVGVTAGSGSFVGSISAAEMPSTLGFPALFEFTTSLQGDFIRLDTAAAAPGDFVLVHQVERVLDWEAAPADDTQQPNAIAAGTATDPNNAVDGDTNTFASATDGQFVHADWPAPAAYDAQVIRIELNTVGISTGFADGFAAYLGDVRGGTPTAILTADSNQVNDIVAAGTVAGEKAQIELYSNVSDDDLYVYGQGSDVALQIYRIERDLIRFASQFNQLGTEVFGGRTGIPAELFQVRLGGRENNTEQEAARFGAWFEADPVENDPIDIEWDAPPTAITTTQAFHFWAVGVTGAIYTVRIGATRGAGAVAFTIPTVSSADSGVWKPYSFETSDTGNWARFETIGANFQNFNFLSHVSRTLADSPAPTVQSQTGSAASGTATDDANAIDGDPDTHATLALNAFLKVTFAAPAAYDEQLLRVRFSTESDPFSSGKPFSIFAGGDSGSGVALVGDGFAGDYSETRLEGTVDIILRTTETTNEFWFYNLNTFAGPGMKVYEVTRELLTH